MISHIEDGSAQMGYEKILVLIREYTVNESEYLDLDPMGIEALDKRSRKSPPLTLAASIRCAITKA